MYDDLSRLNDDQLRNQLVEAYSKAGAIYPDSEAVTTLKGELYRRGHERDEIVVLALAALIRRSLN